MHKLPIQTGASNFPYAGTDRMNLTPELEQKLEALRATLASLDSLLVAYSGGTDSAYLAYAAHQVLGNRMLAVIADSPSLPRRELAAALAFASAQHIPVHILQTRELEDPNYSRNDKNRCFHCKDELFTQMEAARLELGFAHLAYGMNLDDRGDFRPGQKAAAMHNALAPLVTANLTKPEIRDLAREAGLAVADKPASACLSSRIEYGRAVTSGNLSQVERAEDALHALGFLHVRVRHHGDLARVEIARPDLSRALTLPMLDQITAALRPLGFAYITLDTQGYRSGSMNDVLPVSAIASAHEPLAVTPTKRSKPARETA
jgi:pyridinium-3,5-biscarboxylic acid mononucleotide sulfurtransferase